MFCPKCGEEIADDAVICPKCGREVAINKPETVAQESDKPKTGMGVILALFLGLIGLIIGICLYKEGTIARKTFLKAWVITYVVLIVIIAVFYGSVFAGVMSSM